MKYRLFGKSGLGVSEAALGTMTFGQERSWGAPKDESRKVYDAFAKPVAISSTPPTSTQMERVSRSLASF